MKNVLTGLALLLALCLALFLPLSAVGAEGFVIKDSTGKEWRLADLRGKWVVVNFWAPWCPPCLEEMPDLVDAYEARRGKDLMVIGVALDYESKQEVMRLADSMLVSYPIVLDQRVAKSQFGVIKGLPASWIYDPKGNLTMKHLGKLTPAQLARATGG